MFGQNLKKLRTSKNLSQSKLSKILGISSSTIGMYEQGRRFPDYLLGRNPQNPPTEFNNATDAMEFILKLPTVMAYGGYDATKLSDEEIIDFANDLLQQIELISYKYKKK